MVPPRTGSRVSGGTWPAAIWAGFMGATLAGRPVDRFPRPDTRLVQLALGVQRGCLPNRFTPAAEVASVVYLKAAAPTRTCREPEGPLAGVVPAVVGVPVARAAGWLEAAGLSLAQRLRMDGEVPPGTVLAQAGLDAEVLAGCDADPASAAARPGRVWRAGPASGSQSPVGGRVRLWVNPPSCPPPTTAAGWAGRATPTTTGR
jgi:hypothetical protein